MEKPIIISRIKGTRPAKAIYRCECGAEFQAYCSNVSSGKTSSCGCYRRAIALEKMAKNKKAFSQGNPTHGKYHFPTFQSWNMMKQRCNNPNRDNYPYYGGRGIRVCERWESYENSIDDMGKRPRGTTLDRVDNDGDYSPGNCRWSTMKAQSNNRRARGTCLTAEQLAAKAVSESALGVSGKRRKASD